MPYLDWMVVFSWTRCGNIAEENSESKKLLPIFLMKGDAGCIRLVSLCTFLKGQFAGERLKASSEDVTIAATSFGMKIGLEMFE